MDAIVEDPKSFAFSFSRLKAFEDCPRRYHETMVKKDAWPEEKSSMLQKGDEIHIAMAEALRDGTPLETKHRIYQKWIKQVNRSAGELLIEDDCQLAITRNKTPTPWFAKNVWMRCIADAIKLDLPTKTARVVDWKTGKSINGDPVQLIMTSLMLFAHFPDLKEVRSYFIWLQEGTKTKQVVLHDEVEDYWDELTPRAIRLENATRTEAFPPMPGRFCKRWCVVKSCEYHGK